MGNAILALQALSTILTTIGTASEAAMRIKATLDLAQSEGRDVSDAELAAIQAETDALETAVLDKLKAAASGSVSGEQPA